MAENSNDFDVIIIGGGPGGLSAALWCADLGLKAIILEKEAEFGGQLLWTFNAIKNYLGIEAKNGRELRDLFVSHLEHVDLRHVFGASIARADLRQRTVILADGTKYSARAIIIATGVRRRKLEVPGEVEFKGRGILESGSKDKETVRNKTVVIAGGGDAALENALILSETAAKVIVVHRRAEFSARSEFVERAKDRKNVEFLFDTQVTAIIGNETVKTVGLQNVTTGQHSEISADAILVRIGVVPNTELFHAQIALDEVGYINIDSRCSTNVDRVYAIGDIASPVVPTIANAAGQGSSAAKAIFNRFHSK